MPFLPLDARIDFMEKEAESAQQAIKAAELEAKAEKGDNENAQKEVTTEEHAIVVSEIKPTTVCARSMKINEHL